MFNLLTLLSAVTELRSSERFMQIGHTNDIPAVLQVFENIFLQQQHHDGLHY